MILPVDATVMTLPAWLLEMLWGSKDKKRHNLPHLAVAISVQSADFMKEMITDRARVHPLLPRLRCAVGQNMG